MHFPVGVEVFRFVQHRGDLVCLVLAGHHHIRLQVYCRQRSSLCELAKIGPPAPCAEGIESFEFFVVRDLRCASRAMAPPMQEIASIQYKCKELMLLDGEQGEAG